MKEKLKEYAKWCFDTPKRGLITLAVMLGIATLIYPPILGGIFQRLLDGITPVISFVVNLAVVVAIVGLAIRWILPKGRAKKK